MQDLNRWGNTTTDGLSRAGIRDVQNTGFGTKEIRIRRDV